MMAGRETHFSSEGEHWSLFTPKGDPLALCRRTILAGLGGLREGGKEQTETDRQRECGSERKMF